MTEPGPEPAPTPEPPDPEATPVGDMALKPSAFFRDPREPGKPYVPKRGGAGRPFPKGDKHPRLGVAKKKPIEQQYFEKFKQGCPPERFAAVVRKVVELAEAGDMKAAKLIFDRALPQHRIEDFLKGAAGEGGSVNILVVQADEMQKRKEALRKAVVT